MQRGARVVCPAMIIRSDRGGELFPAQGETNSSVRDCSPLRFPIFDPNLSSRTFSLCLPPSAPNGPFSALARQSVNQRNLAAPPTPSKAPSILKHAAPSPSLYPSSFGRNGDTIPARIVTRSVEKRRKISRIEFNSVMLRRRRRGRNSR